MQTTQLRSYLDQDFEQILVSLNRRFSSQDFISMFLKFSAVHYGEALHQASSARALHSWIARWYLQGKYEQGRLGKLSKVKKKTINGIQANNQLWENKKK